MVKPGYRQTEIGVLPESWDTITFENCFSILPNNTLSRAELNYNGGDVRNIHYGDILVKFPAVLDCSSEELPYINKENVAKASKGFLRDGDLIMADTAEDVIVGKSTEVIGIGDSKVVSGLHTIPCRPKDAEMFAPKWLGYFINHCTYHDQLIPYVTGIKVSSVSKSAISSTVIAVPPKPEQEAIAEALSDIDTLIVNLEKLIAKKKAIKQGAMQELLTGKRRLPGFDGAWINRTIKESCSRVGVGLATSVTQYYRTSGTVIFRNLNIKPNYLDDSDILYLDTDFAMSNPSKIIRTGDVLTVHTGYVGISCVVPPKYDGALTFTTLISTTKSDVLVPEYLAYHLNSDLGHAEIENLQAGGGRNNLNVADFVQYSMVLPIDINEQKAIVNILIDMDREISECESKLEKYNHIKQGMMSELLTGRIRLIDKEDA